MGRLIYEVRDLEEASNELKSKIGKAVLAAAFTIRDEARNDFKQDVSKYKYGTEKYYDLAEGIMIGKLYNGNTVRVHALGSASNYHTYKTRFFVSGTTYRQGVSSNNKVFTKGFIANNDAVDDGLSAGNDVLKNYIQHVLDE